MTREAQSQKGALAQLARVVAMVALCLIGGPAQGAAVGDPGMAATHLKNGLEVWVDTGGPPEWMAVRIEMVAPAEAVESPGLRAAAVAWLVRARSGYLASGGLEAAAHEAACEVLVQFSPETGAITLVGPAGGLERAVWLLAERLHGAPPTPDDVGPAREVIDALTRNHQRNALSPMGDAADTVRSSMHRGAGPRSAFADLLAAKRLGDDELLSTLRVASQLPARVVLVIPPDLAADTRALVRREFAPAPVRVAPGRRAPQLSTLEGPPSAGRVELPNARDARNLLVVGWDLRGAWSGGGATLLEKDVALLVLSQWLSHRGNPIRTSAIQEHALARDLEVDLADDQQPSLVLQAEGRGPELEDLAALLVDGMGRVREGVISNDELLGAGRAAAQRVRRQLEGPVARAHAIGILAQRGHARPYQWVQSTLGLLEGLDPARMNQVIAAGFQPSRRVVASFVPVAPRAEDSVIVDDKLIERYVSLLVDLRCPADGLEADIQTVLEGKYNMSPSRYLAVSRALTRRPEVMRRLVGDADARCEEYARLRGILAPPDVVTMHQEVACTAWPLKGKLRRRKLKKIYKRFDIDPSWRLPLTEMAREDLRYGSAIASIDARCPQPEVAP